MAGFDRESSWGWGLLLPTPSLRLLRFSASPRSPTSSKASFDLIEIVGGALLIIFGIKIWNTHPHLTRNGNPREHGFLADATAAFFMAITNPGAVLAFVAIFGGLGDYRPQTGDHFGALVMVAGVTAGATTWWVLVSASVSHFKSRIDDLWLDRANHIAGFLLVVFGALIYLKLALEAAGVGLIT